MCHHMRTAVIQCFKCFVFLEVNHDLYIPFYSGRAIEKTSFMHKDACQRGTTLFPMNHPIIMDSCMHVTYVNGNPFRVQLPGSNTSIIHQFLSPDGTSLFGGSPAVMSCSSL